MKIWHVLAISLLLTLTACGGSSGSSSQSKNNLAEQDNPTDPSSVEELTEYLGEGEIQVLSNRADLISGGNALIRVVADDEENLKNAVLWLGDDDITEQLETTEQGLMGVVSGLKDGENTLVVDLADESKLKRTIINHPLGGPVFSGPQIQPWNCTNKDVAIDEYCNQPPVYSYKYVPKDTMKAFAENFDPQNPGMPGGFEVYDPENPPAEKDIATVTTDEDVEVPFIVRVEEGVINRDRYQIMALYQPDQAWDALHPQEQWNGKLLIHHGGSVGVSYGMGSPPNGDLAGTLPDELEMLMGDSISVALGQGFVTLSTAQSNLGHNENLVTGAESLMMAKEHIIENYGPLRYTIGTGCSGGAIMQQQIANAYPGIYQGLIVQCSYPDVWTTATQFAEYNAMNQIFGLKEPESPEDVKNLLGTLTVDPGLPAFISFYGHLPINPVVSDLAFFPSANPYQENCPKLEDQTLVYHPQENPHGLRCGLVDYMINQFGPRPEEVWTENEQSKGEGFAGIPLDNVGVQYGLEALQAGILTGEQFLKFNGNNKVQGLSVDIEPQPERTVGDESAIANSYRTGAVNVANNMSNVPIIDLRGLDPGIAHDAFHSWQMRARLESAQGHHDNQVIWYGPIPLAGDTIFPTQALITMDRWLANIEKDDSDKSIETKIKENKPADARDRCLSLASLTEEEHLVPLLGNLLYPEPIIPSVDPSKLPEFPAETGKILDAVTNQVCGLDLDEILGITEIILPESTLDKLGPLGDILGLVTGILDDVVEVLEPVTDMVAELQETVVQTRFATPRMMAGDDIRTLTNKCELKAPDPADYPVNPLSGILDSTEFAEQVAEIFPEGVCDFEKDPVGYGETVPWLHYGDADEVIYGGEALDDSTASNSRQGWAAPAFDVAM